MVDELVAYRSDRLVWATNWPHPGQSPLITLDQIRHLALRWLPTEELRQQVLVENPAILYGYDPATRPGGS